MSGEEINKILEYTTKMKSGTPYLEIIKLLDSYNKEKEKYETEFKTSHYLQSELDQANAKLIEEKENNNNLLQQLQEQNKELLDISKQLREEKEKREIAEENHKVLSLDLAQTLKKLKLYKDTIIADELVLEINKRYISKDKIREKIKILEEQRNIEFETIGVSTKTTTIEILKELLEEIN